MKITVFFIGFQIQDTIAFTIRHYQQFCQRVVYFDNFSTDLSRDIAEQMGAEVRLFGKSGVLDDQAYLDVKLHCWKTDSSDLVIVCDDDEILLHPPKETSATIYKTQGYGMYSNDMPVDRWTDVKTGLPDEQYSKFCIFNPKAITDIGYVFGCHSHQTRPKGKLFWGSEVLPLLHYNRVGGADRLIKRHRMYNEKKRGEANVRWDLGHHYLESETHKRKHFAEQLAKSTTLPFLTGD